MPIELIRTNLLKARLLCDGGVSIARDEECNPFSMGTQFEQIRALLEEISDAM